MSQQTRQFYEFGDYRIEKTERLLMRRGEVVPLPPKAIELLFVLLENNNHVVTKEKLMERVWADSFVEEANLSRNVFLLRKVLDEGETKGGKFIETIPRRGYRFAAHVTETSDGGEFAFTAHERTVAHIVVEEEFEVCDETKPELEGAAQTGTPQISGNKRPKEKIDSPSMPRGGARNRRTYRTIGAILAAAAILGIGAYSWRSGGEPSKQTSAPPAAMSIRRLTTNGKIVNAALSPDGKFFVYALAETGGQSLWIQQTSSAHPVNIAPPTRESYWGMTISPDGVYVYCSVFKGDQADLQLRRIPLLGGHVETLAGTPDIAVSFSPDGRRMAWAERRREKTKIYTARADGSEGRFLAERSYPSEFNVKGSATAWSPDGTAIACVVREVDQNGGEYMSIVGVDAATGAEKSLTARRWATVNHVNWLRDGRLIFIAGESPDAPAQIWALSPPDGELRQLTNDLNSYERLSATADGEMFLSIQRNSVSRLSAAGENQPAEAAPTIAQQVGSFDEIAWTPAGQIAYFSYAGGETNLWLRDADGAHPRQLTNGLQAGRGLAVSPVNRQIVFAAARKGEKINLWRTDIDGQNLTRLTDDGGAFPTFSPDGKSLIYQQGLTSKVLRKISSAGGASVSATEIKGVRPQYSPDGKLVAFFFIDDSTEPEPHWSIGVVSAEDGKFIQKLTIVPTVNERFLRWTPDGKSIAYISNEGDIVKIIVHSLDNTEPPRVLLAFPTEAGGLIQAFAWSPDGRQFAFTRESNHRDAVLLNNFKEFKP